MVSGEAVSIRAAECHGAQTRAPIADLRAACAAAWRSAASTSSACGLRNSHRQPNTASVAAIFPAAGFRRHSLKFSIGRSNATRSPA